MFTVDRIDYSGNRTGSQEFKSFSEAIDEYDYIVDTDQLEGGETIQLWDKESAEAYMVKQFENIDVDYQIALINANFEECENTGLYDISFQKAVRNGNEVELIYATPIGYSVELTQVGENSQNFPLTELDAASLKSLAERTIGIENQKIDYA